MDNHFDMSLCPPPVPAKELLPQWWRDGESFLNKETGKLDIPDKSLRTGGMKTCMPFLDSITSGYMLTTWADIEVYENKNHTIKWKYVRKAEDGSWVDLEWDPDMVHERHGDIGYTMPRPQGYAFNHMAWSSKWGWRTPRGWSMIVTHPYNQFQLPFITLSGFMESDRFVANGNIPFFFKEGWTGIIEKGTPYAQLIPVKRQSWIAYVDKLANDKMGNYLAKMVRSVPYGYYRTNLWTQKKYRMENENEVE